MQWGWEDFEHHLFLTQKLVHCERYFSRFAFADDIGPDSARGCEGESGKVALAVDKLLGQEEVVLKVLPSPLHLIPGLSGVSILGSGKPIFILDVARLLEYGPAGS